MILGEEEIPPVQAGSWWRLNPAWFGNHHSAMDAALLEPPEAKLSSTPSSLQLQGLRGYWLAHLWIPSKPGCQRPTQPPDLFRDTILLFVMLRKQSWIPDSSYLLLKGFLLLHCL